MLFTSAIYFFVPSEKEQFIEDSILGKEDTTPKSISEVELKIEQKIQSNEPIRLGENIISIDSIKEEYSELTAQQKLAIEENTFTKQKINQEILLLEAEKEGITVSDIEVKQLLNSFDSDLEVTTEVKNNIKKNLIVSKLLHEKLDLENFEVTIQEVETVMQENNEYFVEMYAEEDKELEEIFKINLQRRLTVERQEELITNYIESILQEVDIT